MEYNIFTYRQKHPKCKYCKYLRLRGSHNICGIDYYLCIAKDKIIQDNMPNMTQVPRLFCSLYEVDENKIDNK